MCVSSASVRSWILYPRLAWGPSKFLKKRAGQGARGNMLADNGKDGGAVSMFPTLAGEWKEQVDARRGSKEFQRLDFLRLKARYGVDWGVTATRCARSELSLRK